MLPFMDLQELAKKAQEFIIEIDDDGGYGNEYDSLIHEINIKQFCQSIINLWNEIKLWLNAFQDLPLDLAMEHFDELDKNLRVQTNQALQKYSELAFKDEKDFENLVIEFNKTYYWTSINFHKFFPRKHKIKATLNYKIVSFLLNRIKQRFSTIVTKHKTNRSFYEKIKINYDYTLESPDLFY